MHLYVDGEWFQEQSNWSQINQNPLPLKILSQNKYTDTFLWILDTNNNLIDDDKAIFLCFKIFGVCNFEFDAEDLRHYKEGKKGHFSKW